MRDITSIKGHLFFSFVFILLISLTLSTPFIISTELYNGTNSAKQLWFQAVMVIIAFYAPAGLLLNRAAAGIRINITDIALMLFYAYYLVRSLLTQNTPLHHNQKLLNFTLLMVLYIVLRVILSEERIMLTAPPTIKPDGDRSKDNRLTAKPDDSEANDNRMTTPVQQPQGYNTNYIVILLKWLLILTGLAESVWGLLQLYGFADSFHSGFKITGTFFNPAPYALYLAAIFPLALGVALKPPSLLQRVSMLTALTIILVLPATMIRASWVGALAGAAVVLNNRYSLAEKAKRALNTSLRKACAIMVVALITILTVTGLYYLKEGSSAGKLFIWEVTIGKIKEKPLFGHGTGRFEAEYNNWQAEYFRRHPDEMDGRRGMSAGNTRYCFNDYLEMAAETGVTGLLIFLAVALTVFVRNKRLRAQGSGQRVENITEFKELPGNSFIPSLTAILFMMAVSFPLYPIPALILLFIFLAVISAGSEEGIMLRLSGRTFKALKVVIISGLICGGIILSVFTKEQYDSLRVMDEAVMLYETGSYKESCVSFSEVYRHMKYNGAYLQYYAKALLMDGRYGESIEMYERAKIYTSDEMLYCSLGDALKAVKRYSEAEEAYLHASYMTPHKLYPMYMLALLYEETEQSEKALEVAERVLSKDVKVESEAAKEIKMKMRKLIEK